MSFVDNLENNLKALESREERDPARDARERKAAQNRGRSVQPNAEALRNSAFTKELLDHVVRMAHGLRTKVYISWSGNCLRLDAREHRLELQPTPEGIDAVYLTNQRETAREQIKLEGSPEKLARKWLDGVGPRPRPEASPEDIG